MAQSHTPSLQSILSTIQTAQDTLIPSTPELDHAIKNSAAHGLRNIAIGPAQGQFLDILCKSIGAQHVLEVGTLGGYSTLWFANASPTTKVTSIEMDAKHREVALENLESVRERVEVVPGKALEVLPRLKKEGRVFDFVFIDADWGEQGEYYDWAVQMTRKGGIVYVDNAVRNLTESEGREKEAQCLVEKVKGDERVVASLIPTLQTWRTELVEIADGFLIAYVK